MSHADPGPMAGYNSLQDRNLVGYFNNQRMRRHLRRSGLINRRGEIVTESTYRMTMARKEHQRHVRDLMAQAIVHKALDMERHRQAAIKGKLEEIAKVELVRRVRSERARKGDEDIIPFLSPRAPSGRPNSAHSQRRRRTKSASRQRPVTAPTNKASHNGQGAGYVDEDGFPIHRERTRSSSTRSSVTSGEIDSHNLRELDPRMMNEISIHMRPEDRDGLAPYRVNQGLKPHPPRAGGGGQRAKGRPPRSKAASNLDKKRARSKTRQKGSLHRKEPAYPHAGQLQTLCDVTVRYRGNNLKIQYEREDPRDEIMVYQQHCGGENLLVFEGMAEPGTDLVFTSRRHRGYPFSVTFFVNRVQSLRLSACCEYKYTPHSLLGGSKGHFKFIRVEGAAPCYRCMVEAELARRERQRYRGTQTDQPDPPSEAAPKKIVIATQTEEEECKGDYEDDFDDEDRGSSGAKEGEDESDSSEDEKDSHRRDGRSETSDDAFFDSDRPRRREKDGYTDSEFEEDRSKVEQRDESEEENKAESDAEQEGKNRKDGSTTNEEGRGVVVEDERSNITHDDGKPQTSDGGNPRAILKKDVEEASEVDDRREDKIEREINNNYDDAISVASHIESRDAREVDDEDDLQREENASGEYKDGKTTTSVVKEEILSEVEVKNEQSMGNKEEAASDGSKEDDPVQQDEQEKKEDSESESELKVDDDSSDDDGSTSVRSKSKASGHNSEDDYRPLSATSSSLSSDSEAEVEAKGSNELENKRKEGNQMVPDMKDEKESSTQEGEIVLTVEGRGETPDNVQINDKKSERGVEGAGSGRDGDKNDGDHDSKFEEGIEKQEGDIAPSTSTKDQMVENLASVSQLPASDTSGDEREKQDKEGSSDGALGERDDEAKENGTDGSAHSTRMGDDTAYLRSDVLQPAEVGEQEKKQETVGVSSGILDDEAGKQLERGMDEDGVSPKEAELDEAPSLKFDVSKKDDFRQEKALDEHVGNSSGILDDEAREQFERGKEDDVASPREAEQDEAPSLKFDVSKDDFRHEEDREEHVGSSSGIQDENDNRASGIGVSGEGDAKRDQWLENVSDESVAKPKDFKTGEQGDQEMDKAEDRKGGNAYEERSGRKDIEGDIPDSDLETARSTDASQSERIDNVKESEVSSTAGKEPRKEEGQEGELENERQNEKCDGEGETRSSSEESDSTSSDVSEPRPPVTVLNLNEKGITPDRAAKLAESLLKSRYNQVQYLLIRSNPIGDKGLTSIVRSLISLHKDNPLDNSQSGLKLTHLDLGDTQITNKGINELAELLKLPTRLENLNLSDNTMSKLGWLALAAGVRENSALKTLSVEYMNLGDEGCREICEAATDSKMLKELNLEGNDIGDLGGEAILKMLRENERIETVNFERDNNISRHIAQEIKDML